MKNNTNRILFFTLFLFVLTDNPISAQKGLWYGVSIGVQNTYLRSWLRSEIDAKNTVRPVTAINLEYQFSPKAAIQSGIGYSLFTQNTSKFKNNLNYLTIPLYFKGGSLKDDRKHALSYFGGINFNYLLSAQNLYQGEKNDIVKYTSSFHQDIVFGIGMKHKIRDNFLLETYLMGAAGGTINKASTDGFALMNMNYGAIVSVKYQFRKK